MSAPVFWACWASAATALDEAMAMYILQIAITGPHSATQAANCKYLTATDRPMGPSVTKNAAIGEIATVKVSMNAISGRAIFLKMPSSPAHCICNCSKAGLWMNADGPSRKKDATSAFCMNSWASTPVRLSAYSAFCTLELADVLLSG